MDPARSRLVNEILGEILDAPPENQESLLAQRCASDAALRAEVETLIRAYARAGDTPKPFIEASGLDPIDAPFRADTRIGPYRLIRQIGQGGMGVVYLAEREDEFRMRVAIKVVRSGFGDSLLRRFQHERQILANLDHPNIAKLLDGGTTADGSPYLVMEHVGGEPITRYCETRQLPVAARLRLFQSVCAAVQYAHQHLIVHRDLKPVNILVTADGVPKLLDFGIAKLLEEGGEEQTGTGLHPHTPAYASPEQVSAQVVTTSTDVYSLGVILFELLCGARPYAIASSSALEIQRAIVETTPPLPSALKPDLSRDIDGIVAMAMRKEPTRRYVSAAAFSDDIERHLGNFPILGRRDSRSYRLGRFVKRNRRGVIAVSLAAIALIAVTIFAARQAQEARAGRALAEKRFADARRIANSLVFELHDAIEKVPGNTENRALLLRRASEWLDALAADAPGDATLAEELAAAYERLGEALGGGGGVANLGETVTSVAAYRKAFALRDQLAKQAPENAERQARLGLNRIDLSYVLVHGPEALDHARAAVRIAQTLQTASPEDPVRNRRLATAYYAEGSVQAADGHWPDAEASFQQAAKIFEALLDREPGNQTASRNVGLANKRLGGILLRQERIPEAIERYGRALALDEAQVARNPEDFQTRYDVSVSHVDMGDAKLALKEAGRALDHYQRAAAIRERLVKEDPANVMVRGSLGRALMGIGSARAELKENQRALASLKEAEALLDPGSTTEGGEDLADVRAKMAWVNRSLGRSAEGARLARLAIEGHQAVLSARPTNAVMANAVAWDFVGLAVMLRDSGDPHDREAGCQRYRDAARVVSELKLRLAAEPRAAELNNTIDKGLAACGADPASPVLPSPVP